MLWRVNTTHTMGVDVIDKTVEGGREGGSIDTKSLEWRGLFFHSLEDMQLARRPYKALCVFLFSWILQLFIGANENCHCRNDWPCGIK